MIYFSCNFDIYFFDKTSHFLIHEKILPLNPFCKVFPIFSHCYVPLLVMYIFPFSIPRQMIISKSKRNLKKLLNWFFENCVVIRQILCSIFNICYSISFINENNAWVWLDPYMMIPPDCRVIWTSTTYTLYKSLPFWKWWGLKVVFWKKYII